MFKYLVVYEKADKNYSAYIPDLPGCVATGGNKAETARNINRAVKMHLNGLREDGIPAPEPQASAEFIEIE